MCVHLRFVFIDHQSEPLADASMFEIPNRGVVVGSGSADSGANFHQNTSPKTPRPEPNHQEHQQRYNRKGIRGKNQAKPKQEKQTNKIQNHSALFLRSCFIALVFVVSLDFLAQHHCNLFSF